MVQNIIKYSLINVIEKNDTKLTIHWNDKNNKITFNIWAHSKYEFSGVTHSKTITPALFVYIRDYQWMCGCLGSKKLKKKYKKHINRFDIAQSIRKKWFYRCTPKRNIHYMQQCMPI